MPDYIMRWLASRFLDADCQEELGIMTAEVRARKTAQEAATSLSSDSAGPANGGGNGGNGGNGGAKPAASTEPKAAASSGDAPQPAATAFTETRRWSRPASRASTSARRASSAAG
jgi:ribonucleoside-diphosphate reductase alpha chain